MLTREKAIEIAKSNALKIPENYVTGDHYLVPGIGTGTIAAFRGTIKRGLMRTIMIVALDNGAHIAIDTSPPAGVTVH